MVYVQLAKDWTDRDGVTHHVGESVDIDPVTLAELESAGVVSPTQGAGSDWIGISGGEQPKS